MNHNHTNPEEPWNGFLRIKTVLRLIPVSRATWYSGVKTGRYPAPVHPSPGSSAWLAEDIQALIEKISKGEAK